MDKLYELNGVQKNGTVAPSHIIISKTNARVMEGWVLSPYCFGPAEYFLMASWIKMLNKYELQS